MLLIGWALALMATPVTATSVLQFSVDELSDHAALVIEGRVLSAEPRVESPGGKIATYVRIAVLDRLKGPDVGNEIELRFVGGTVGAHTLEVSDMLMPAVGETGIYFVESLHARQVNPLVGWSQGHFTERVDPQTGRRGVYTPAGRAVLGIRATGAGAQERQVLPGTGTALGLLVEEGLTPARPAMSAADFKAEIRRRVAARTPPGGKAP
jgi:hypothetical protein